MIVQGQMVQTRHCMKCGEAEDPNSGLTVYPVWAWYGRFMGRWCDWCRELRCWDCGETNADCAGSCSERIPYEWAGEQTIAASSIRVA